MKTLSRGLSLESQSNFKVFTNLFVDILKTLLQQSNSNIRLTQLFILTKERKKGQFLHKHSRHVTDHFTPKLDMSIW